MKKILNIILCMILAIVFVTGCSNAKKDNYTSESITTEKVTKVTPEAATTEQGTTEVPENLIVVEKAKAYYDLEHVIMYINSFHELPPNYITKADAKGLGWEGGSVEKYLEGAAIGGDYFGNYEGLLPTDKKYTECDIDTLGASGRGAKRLIFSNDYSYFYTADHYESFTEYVVEDGQIKKVK